MFDICRLLRCVTLLFLLVVTTQHWASATMYKAQIDVVVDSTETVVFRFSSDTGMEVPINMFSVVGQTNGKYDHQNPVWLLALSPGSYKRISEIRYGQAVDGFPRNDAQQLVEGQRYLASIEGAGISESVEFELVHFSGKIAIRVLKAK